MTFDQAQGEFRADPSRLTADAYKKVAKEYFDDDRITGETFNSAMYEIAEFLVKIKKQ